MCWFRFHQIRRTCRVPASAEGIIVENGDDRKIISQRLSEEEERCEGLIEGSNALPSLQELLDGIDLDYDLEELAESLVADLHTNMEVDSPTGDSTDAKEDGSECKLSGPVVDKSMSWSRKSRMESAKDCSRGSLRQRSNTKREHDATKQPKSDDETYSMDKIYYDNDIPVKGECFEVEVQEMLELDHNEDDESEEQNNKIDDLDDDDICLKFKSSPVDRLISPIPHSEYDDIKSPLNTISDCGYESQGSPISLHEFSSQNDFDLLINDLFPALA